MREWTDRKRERESLMEVKALRGRVDRMKAKLYDGEESEFWKERDKELWGERERERER